MMIDAAYNNDIPKPLGIHPEATHGPGFACVVSTEEYFLILRWCCRNQCGGVYSSLQKRWTLTTPITFGDFLDLLKAYDLLPAEAFDSWEMRRWIKACRLADS